MEPKQCLPFPTKCGLYTLPISFERLYRVKAAICDLLSRDGLSQPFSRTWVHCELWFPPSCLGAYFASLGAQDSMTSFYPQYPTFLFTQIKIMQQLVKLLRRGNLFWVTDISFNTFKEIYLSLFNTVVTFSTFSVPV